MAEAGRKCEKMVKIRANINSGTLVALPIEHLFIALCSFYLTLTGFLGCIDKYLEFRVKWKKVLRLSPLGVG